MKEYITNHIYLTDKYRKGTTYQTRKQPTYVVHFNSSILNTIRTFKTLEEAKSYEKICSDFIQDTKFKQDLNRNKQEPNTQPTEFPENFLHELGVTYETHPNLYSEIIPAFEQSMDELIEKSSLSKRERVIIYLYYQDHLNFAQIGRKLGVTRERIRQIIRYAQKCIIHNQRNLSILTNPNKTHLIDQQTLEQYKQEITEKLAYDLLISLGYKITPTMTSPDDIIIEELDLDSRTYNSLKRNHIDTVGQLINHSVQDLAKIRTIGKKALSNIINQLKYLNLELKEDN